MGNSTKSAKPAKPYPDFPLFPHATKRWAKKIRGKLHYFGKWDDPQGALDRYLDQKDDLHAGRTPRVNNGDGPTVRDLCNQFLTSKRHLLDTREIVGRTFRDYHAACANVVSAFGKTRLVADLSASDFEQFRRDLSKTRGPVALGNEIGRVRSVFKYAYDQGLVEKPIRYGQGFKKPSAKTLRITRANNGERMFEAAELRIILKAAPQPLRAMILLGVNCGYGNSDVSAVPMSVASAALESGWLNYPRPKTGVQRRCPLWPETMTAPAAAITGRPTPKTKEDEDLCFITKYGKRWVKPTNDDAIAKEFTKLLTSLDLKRDRIGFYALRHTFETIAGSSKDQVAVNAIMGHVDSSMAGVYRERIDDERLQTVVDVVHDWLFQ